MLNHSSWAELKDVALEVSVMQHVILLINAIYLSFRYVLLEIVVEQSYKSNSDDLQEQGRNELKQRAS